MHVQYVFVCFLLFSVFFYEGFPFIGFGFLDNVVMIICVSIKIDCRSHFLPFAVFLFNGVPFVGFGFLDNLVMIVCVSILRFLVDIIC